MDNIYTARLALVRQKSAGRAVREKVSSVLPLHRFDARAFKTLPSTHLPCQRIAGERALIEEFVGDIVHCSHVAIGLGRCPIEQLDDTVEKLQHYSTLASNNTCWHKAEISTLFAS
jgi:hypothetical protein